MKNSRFQAAFAKNLRCAPIRAGHSINVNAVDSIIIMYSLCLSDMMIGPSIWGLMAPLKCLA